MAVRSPRLHHWLNPILALLWLPALLIVAGCGQQSGITTATTSSVDGVDLYSTRARIDGSTGSFECRKSASGLCHYVLFVEKCGTRGAGPASGCGISVIRQFTLKEGQVREVRDLPRGVSHCLDHQAMPVAPACKR